VAKNLNISEARNRLTRLPEELAETRETLAVTKRGKPVLAVMSWDLFEAISETLEIMGDPELMAEFRRGVRDLKQARVHAWDEVKTELGQ